MEIVHINAFDVSISTFSWCQKLRQVKELRYTIWVSSYHPALPQPNTGSFQSVMLLLHKRRGSIFNTKNVSKKLCIELMSKRNIKCIKFVMPFILNNSALQKLHSKLSPKSQSACKSLYNIHHQSIIFKWIISLTALLLYVGQIFFGE